MVVIRRLRVHTKYLKTTFGPSKKKRRYQKKVFLEINVLR